MEFTDVIYGENIKKRFRGFELNIPKLRIPKGFATALIGENGAGKTTLLNLLAGIRLDYKGDIYYFDEREQDVEKVRERLGYTGAGLYFLPHWNQRQVAEVSELLFDNFDRKKYERLCQDLSLAGGNESKKISTYSDGNKMKLVLATVLARET